MRVAIASGKGGTGKTTVAVNLAVTAARNGEDVTYVDCDVEEPNGHIFLSPAIKSSRIVTTPVPRVDENKCNSCGECGKICQFKAIVLILDKVLTFPELCHGCGGCKHVCPVDAIEEVPRDVGRVESGSVVLHGNDELANGGRLKVIQGMLNVREAMSPPVIRVVKEMIPESGLVIVDVPPGASCPVVESVRGADYAILVTEPTPFGLHDLKIAVETIREIGIPMGVVINRCDIGDRGVERYCESEGIELLARIPDDRRVAEAYSRGDIVAEVIPEFGDRMQELLHRIYQEAVT